MSVSMSVNFQKSGLPTFPTKLTGIDDYALAMPGQDNDNDLK